MVVIGRFFQVKFWRFFLAAIIDHTTPDNFQLGDGRPKKTKKTPKCHQKTSGKGGKINDQHDQHDHGRFQGGWGARWSLVAEPPHGSMVHKLICTGSPQSTCRKIFFSSHGDVNPYI